MDNFLERRVTDVQSEPHLDCPQIGIPTTTIGSVWGRELPVIISIEHINNHNHHCQGPILLHIN